MKNKKKQIQLEIDRLCKIQNEQNDEFSNLAYSTFYTAEFMTKQGKLVNDKIAKLQLELQS